MQTWKMNEKVEQRATIKFCIKLKHCWKQKKMIDDGFDEDVVSYEGRSKSNFHIFGACEDGNTAQKYS